MWVVKIQRNGEWISWFSAANPRLCDEMVAVLKVANPSVKWVKEYVEPSQDPVRSIQL